MSQPELGRRARVSAKFIGQIERCESNPSLESMAMVAAALDCQLSDLLPSDPSPAFVTLREADLRRAQDALTVAVTALRRRSRLR